MDVRYALFVAGSMILVGFVCANAYAAAELLRRSETVPNLLLHPLEVAGRFAFVGACVLLGWLSGLPPAQLGWVDDRPVENAVLGLLAAAVLQEGNHRGTRLAVSRYGRQVYSAALLRAMLPRTRREWLLAPLALLPAAAAEELLFRSLVVGGFAVIVNPWLLALFFSCVFGIAHLPQGRLGVVGAGALGFGLSALFLWRWSVVACVVAHWGVNVAQLARARAELRWLEES